MKDLLKGIRILDFTRLLPGPYATKLLTDLGADVLKIESLDGGDYGRYMPPLVNNYGCMFHSLNHNKKSLTLNLKKSSAVQIVHRLLGHYDVVIESYRSGVMERLGIGYKHLSQIRPDLIYLSLSAYGATGPYAGRAGHDLNIEALAGLSSVLATEQSRPVVPGVQVADMVAGMFIALGISSAVVKRMREGVGSYFDLSMADCVLSFMTVYATVTDLEEKPFLPKTNILNGAYLCYNIYETKDGRFMSVGALEPQFWPKVCEAVGSPELLEEGGSPAREDNPSYRRLRDIFLSKTQAQWIEIFKSRDACVEPILDTWEAVNHPIFRGREMMNKIDDPIDGKVLLLQNPLTVDNALNLSPGPKLGQHSEQILKEIGFTEDDIERFRQEGTVS